VVNLQVRLFRSGGIINGIQSLTYRTGRIEIKTKWNANTYSTALKLNLSGTVNVNTYPNLNLTQD